MTTARPRHPSPSGFPLRFLRGLTLIAAISLRADLPPAPPADPAWPRFEFVAPHMGTLFRIVLFAPDAPRAQAAAAAAFARVAELNRILSDYDPASEVMGLTRQPVGTAVVVSPVLFDLLQCSQELAVASGGAFDVTLGPMVRLWREARRSQTLPSPAERTAARRASGHARLRLNPAHRAVTLGAPGMQLDFGGIAKGFAADEALAVLARLGLTQTLVAASGDLALGDAPPGTLGWKVQVDPFGQPSPESWSLVATHVGVSTSGDTEQFAEINGIRYSHIVNPATALGLTSNVAVTVIASHAALSDRLATACRVLAEGPSDRMDECLGASARAIVLRRRESGPLRREVHGGNPPGLRSHL